MIHRKARSLMSAPEAIATVAAAALSQAASQQTGPTGSVVTHNSDGTKTITGSVLATDATGTSVTTATHVGDTTPPGVPTGITAWSGDGTVHVAWDGTLEGGIPADFDHVTLLATTSTTTLTLGKLTKAGSVTCSSAGWTNLWPGSSIVSTNTGTTINWGHALSGYIPVSAGDSLVISLFVDGVRRTDKSKGYAYLLAYDSSKTRVGSGDAARSYVVGTLSPNYVIPSGVSYVQAHISTGPGTSGSTFRGKLERGTKATDWSPSPGDMALGSTVSVTATSEDDVCAIDGTAAHNVSAPCVAVSVVVTDTADSLTKLIRETEDGVDVGKSADGTTYAEGTSVTRQGTDGSFSILKMVSGVLTSVATFASDLIELGKNSTSAVIKMCGGKVSVFATPDAKGRYMGILSGDYGSKICSANGTTALSVDGFQDLISMISGNMQIDDGTDALEQVSTRRFLTAIQPTVLFDGPATTGTVTLSETAENFEWMTIYYHYACARAIASSVTLHSPNGWQAGLYLMYFDTPNLWIKTRSVAISGTSITNSNKAANYALSLSNGQPALYAYYDTPEIVVDRVEGRR